MKTLIYCVLTVCIFTACSDANSKKQDLRIYDAPKEGVLLSKDFKVEVNKHPLSVYACKVSPRNEKDRWAGMDDKINSGNYFEMASFTYFDMSAPVNIEVTASSDISTVKILPSRLNIKPTIKGNTISFSLEKPEKITVEINDNHYNSLHILASEVETDVPKENDPNVIYYGPGIHEITEIVVKDNQTLYIAGGAILRSKIDPNAEDNGPAVTLNGNNIKVRGRGIIDGTLCPTHSKNLMAVKGNDISIEGVIFLDSPAWTLPVNNSNRVHISDIKMIGYRANSDGIDISSSNDVTVDNCFIRTLDDLVVIKTYGHRGKASNILVQNCVLWNEVAHALSIGAELTDDVDNVIFRNCDVIRDKGREWSLRIYHTDGATISNVLFEDIRIEESRKLISLWIDEAVWSSDDSRGNIRNVTFKNITASGSPLTVEMKGFDKEHTVEGVILENVIINGQSLKLDDISINDYTKDIVVK